MLRCLFNFLFFNDIVAVDVETQTDPKSTEDEDDAIAIDVGTQTEPNRTSTEGEHDQGGKYSFQATQLKSATLQRLTIGLVQLANAIETMSATLPQLNYMPMQTNLKKRKASEICLRKPRNVRTCTRCSKYGGQNASTCPGRGSKRGNRGFKYFDEDGTKKIVIEK